MIRADIWLSDPASVLAAGAFDAGALIRLERSDDAGDTYAEITTIPVVATTVQYQYWDADGDETSLYQWRVSDAGDTIQSPYSAPFAGTNPAASVLPASYATLAKLLSLWETSPPSDPDRLVRLGSILGNAATEINKELRRDYFRHPTTGTATWTVDTNRRTDLLHQHGGIVSASLVEITTDGTTYTELESTDWVLRGSNPRSEATLDGEPWFHVVLNPHGSLRQFPIGLAAVRLTGANGWDAPPTDLVEANAQRARQVAYADISFSGSAPGGQDQYGQSMTSDRWFTTMLWNFMKRERMRFRTCV